MTRPRQATEPTRPTDLAALDPVALGVAISLLPPNHELVVAARAAAEVSEARHERQVALRDASKDIAGDRVWVGYASRHLPHDELQRRRAEPGRLARRVPEPREASDSKEGNHPDTTAAAVHRARSACQTAVAARQDGERAGELNRWAADDAAAEAAAAAGDARLRA